MAASLGGETRVVHLAGSISASAAATGYAQTDYPGNTILILDILNAGGGYVTVALSSGTATGAAGTAVTSVTASATGVTSWRLADKLGKYTYCSASGSAGTPTYAALVENRDFMNSEMGATAQRPVGI